jgi:hypothetical protein
METNAKTTTKINEHNLKNKNTDPTEYKTRISSTVIIRKTGESLHNHTKIKHVLYR